MKKVFLLCFFIGLLVANDELFKQATKAYNDGECEKAVKLYEKLEKAKHYEAIFNYAWMHEKGLCVDQEYKKARELYKISSNANSENTKRLSQYRLGLLLITARGADDVNEADIKRAISLWESSESLGYAQASLSLGMLYFQGTAVVKDEKKAREYFAKACDGGVKEACGIIANLKVE